MTTPKRIQRRRTKGWRMPPNTKSCCRPGKYGNPYVIGTGADAEIVTRMHRIEWERIKAEEPERFAQMVKDLRGYDLACFCAEDAEWCHVDNYLELANPQMEKQND